MRLPWGVPSFEKIRRQNLIYVDKTEQIVELARKNSYVFLSRPRRFGKSLLVSTLAALFRHGNAALKGLKGEGEWTEPEHPVVTLDFSAMKSLMRREDFVLGFDCHLRHAIVQAGFKTPQTAMAPQDRWDAFLRSFAGDDLVVLIDEYDAPLTARLNDAKLFDEAREVVASFFDVTKIYSGKFRFLFVTGIMKFRQASIFSSFNNIRDISLLPEYGALLGYTEDEVKTFFAGHLRAAARVLETSVDDVLVRLKTHYDGFCFDRRASTHVYSPWSVLSFLDRPQDGYKNYWFDSAGSPQFLVNFLKAHGALQPQSFDAPVEMQLSTLESADHIEALALPVVLSHAGYLTIKEAGGTWVRMGYPNEEVRLSMGLVFSTAFWPDRSGNRGLAGRLVEALASGDAEAVLKAMNALVHCLDYQDFTLTNEAAVRQLLQVFCLGADIPNRIEVHSPKGRSDLEISTAGQEIVFEFKFARKGERVQALLAKALEQMRERDYGNPGEGNEFVRLAVVFSGVKRKFVAARFA